MVRVSIAVVLRVGVLLLLATLPLAASDGVSPERLRLARHYLYGGLLWGTLGQLWLLAVLALVVFTGASARVRTALQRGLQRLRPGLTVRWPLTLAAAILLIVLVELAGLPFEFYLGFVREHAFGFSHLGAAAWWGEWGKTVLVALLLSVPAILLAYAILQRWPRRWWLPVWGLCVLLAIFSVAIEPVFIAPLFNHFTPLPAGPLRTRILQMAQQAGIPARQVYVVDRSRQSGHTNAYVVGVLGTERIVLYDTILKAQTPQEIEFVMGHEMGHSVLHHLWKGLAYTAALLLVGLFLTAKGFAWAIRRWRLGITDAGDVAGLPLLLLLLGGLLFLASPLSNGFSRWEEHRADAFGLSICRCPQAAAQGFEREIDTDLIDPDPPRWIEWWYFTHPSQQERIDFARQWGERHEEGGE